MAASDHPGCGRAGKRGEDAGPALSHLWAPHRCPARARGPLSAVPDVLAPPWRRTGRVPGAPVCHVRTARAETRRRPVQHLLPLLAPDRPRTADRPGPAPLAFGGALV